MSRKKDGGRSTRDNDVLKSRDKVLTKMTKDGLVEQNVTTNVEKRVSKRDKRFDLRNNPSDMPVNMPTNDVTADMPADIYNAMFPIGEAAHSDGGKINITDNHADYSSSSQVGTTLNSGNVINIAEADAAKRNAAKKRQRQSYSKNSGNGMDAKPIPSPLAEICNFPQPLENEEHPGAGNPISKPKTAPAAEHESRGRIRRKSKTPAPLTEQRASNLRQSPKPGKFIVAPAVDENGRRIDFGGDNMRQPPKRRQPSHKNQFQHDTENVGKLKFADDIDTSAVDDFANADETLHGVVDGDIVPHEHDPTNQPRSPTVSPLSLRSRQLRNSRKYNNLKNDTASELVYTEDKTAGDKLEQVDKKRGFRNSEHDTHSDTADSSASSENTQSTSTRPASEERVLQSDFDTPKPSKKIIKLEHRVEKASGKLDKAKSNLPAKRKIGIERVSDEATGKSKTRLKFDKEIKTQREHLKGAVPLRPVKFAANTAITKAHMKIYQAEHENVGTQAAHRVELAGEAVVRSALRHRKLAPYKKVAKLERKLAKRSSKLAYQRALHENPRLKKKPITRFWQKRKLKRKHIKAAKQAQQAAAKAKKAGSLTTRAVQSLSILIKKNPKVVIIVILLFAMVNIISSLFGALSGIGGSGAGAIFATTYLSEESEIEAISLAYNRWEMDLMMEILNAEENNPGFDEYRFNTGEISHNPFELMAYLTATRYIFTFSEIETELRALFDEQYQLSFIPSVEVRFRDSGEVDGEGNPIYEPYDWHVMTVTLVARNFTDVIFNRMTSDQRLHYDLLMQSRGQRQIVGNPFNFPWRSFISSEYGYRIHPITGVRDLHRGIDIGVPTGTEILAGFDGMVIFADYNGGYGNVVFIQGEGGLEARYAHMDTISVTDGQTVEMGDIIGTVGNTGTSTGPHLHMEVLRNGQHLNPIFFVSTGDFGFTWDYGIPGAAMSDATFAELWTAIEPVLGRPYVWGASGPNAFDCSGFIFHVFNQSGVMNIPRTTAQGYYNMSTRISRGELQPGDLVFFHGTFSTYRTVTHVGIYVGNGNMAHAGTPVQIASFETPYWTRHFYGFGRLIN